MDADKRQSLRVPAKLPCEWHHFDQMPSRTYLEQQFCQSLHHLGPVQLRTLDDGIQKAISGIADAQTKQALSLLSQKCELLAHQFAYTLPNTRDVILSLEGMNFTSKQQFSLDEALGIHIVIDGYHFLSPALVTDCNTTPNTSGSFRCGLKFCDLEQADAKHLARYLMRTASRVAN